MKRKMEEGGREESQRSHEKKGREGSRETEGKQCMSDVINNM